VDEEIDTRWRPADRDLHHGASSAPSLATRPHAGAAPRRRGGKRGDWVEEVVASASVGKVEVEMEAPVGKVEVEPVPVPVGKVEVEPAPVGKVEVEPPSMARTKEERG